MQKRLGAVVSLLLLAISVTTRPTAAHHGTAAYDMTKLVTIKGIITDFQWSNPHAEIDLTVKNEAGNVEKWIVETNSPNVLARAGWSKQTFKAGDSVTVYGYRAKNGSLMMRLGAPAGKVVMADGKNLLPDSY